MKKEEKNLLKAENLLENLIKHTSSGREHLREIESKFDSFAKNIHVFSRAYPLHRSRPNDYMYLIDSKGVIRFKVDYFQNGGFSIREFYECTRKLAKVEILNNIPYSIDNIIIPPLRGEIYYED